MPSYYWAWFICIFRKRAYITKALKKLEEVIGEFRLLPFSENDHLPIKMWSKYIEIPQIVEYMIGRFKRTAHAQTFWMAPLSRFIFYIALLLFCCFLPAEVRCIDLKKKSRARRRRRLAVAASAATVRIPESSGVLASVDTLELQSMPRRGPGMCGVVRRASPLLLLPLSQ